MIPKIDWRALWATVVHNWLLKLASVAFAVALWGFVNLGAREADMSMFVPLELRGLPAGLMITNPLPESVGVRVRGPRTILGTIDQRRQRILLDLTSVVVGSTSFKVDSDMLNLPRGVTVTRLSPVQITLNVERIVERTLPVVANLAGATPPGYRIVESEVRPVAVLVTGPSTEIGALRNIPTAPLHLSQTSGNFQELVPLERPTDLVKLSPDRVVVRGKLEEIVSSQDFRNVEIGIHNPPSQYEIRPRSVDVTVRGPQRLTKELHLTAENLFVDLSGLGPGSHLQNVQASLPDGLEVLESRPPTAAVESGGKPARKTRNESKRR